MNVMAVNSGRSRLLALLLACAFFLEVLPAVAAAKTIVVSPDKSYGQFTTVMAAISSIKPHSKTPVTILIRPGIYHEHIVIPRGEPPITLLGEDPDNTILVYSLIAYDKGPNGKPIGTFSTQSTWVQDNHFSAANITFANDSGISGNGYDGQALAIRVDGDQCVFYNCHFLGWQDTILLNQNRQYFDHCQINGAVDFIFGNATAFFRNCKINCLGYGCITAPRTPQSSPYGFVFSHCRITVWTKPGDTWLGRPWGPYAASTFMDCYLPGSLNPAGWMHWMDKKNPETARFAEFGNKGPGAGKRPAWIKELTKAQARKITVARVLGGTDHWKPEAEVKALRSRIHAMRHH